MTNLEAYRWLYVHFAPCGDETKQDEAVCIALSAIKKQIPKKPLMEFYVNQAGGIGKKCVCGQFVNRYASYCENCGQRIKR